MIPPATPSSPRTVWSVSALLLATGDALAARFGAVAVRGELSGFSRASSGHCYFSLKDAAGHPALLRCAMFRRAASASPVASSSAETLQTVRGDEGAAAGITQESQHWRGLGTPQARQCTVNR